MQFEIVKYIPVGKRGLLGLVEVRFPDWGLTFRCLRHLGGNARGENIQVPRTFAKHEAKGCQIIRHFDFDDPKTFLRFRDYHLNAIHRLLEEGECNGIQKSEAKH